VGFAGCQWPGLYFLGLPWLSRRGSSFVWGVWHDASHLADQITIQRNYQAYAPMEGGEGSVDCVTTCGTTSQMPSASLREFARRIRPGGHIIFAVVPGPWVDCGYAEILSELESAGKISVQSRGPSFQMLPTTEPEFLCEIWVMKIH